MSLKLDLSEAYNRVEWDFFQAMMEKMAFPITSLLWPWHV